MRGCPPLVGKATKGGGRGLRGAGLDRGRAWRHRGARGCGREGGGPSGVLPCPLSPPGNPVRRPGLQSPRAHGRPGQPVEERWVDGCSEPSVAPQGGQGSRSSGKTPSPAETQQSHPQQTRALYCFIVELKLSIYLLSLPGSPGLGAMIELISAVAPALRLWLSTVGQGGDGEKSCFVCERRKDICQKITTVFLKNARCKTTWI